MAKDLATADIVTALLKNQHILCVVNGSVKRITLDDLMDSINSGDEQLLRSVAWGVPLKQNVQSSPIWGRIGNTNLYAQYKSQVGRYMLKNNGKGAKLSVSDSHYYADGTTVDFSIGHTIVKAPRLYLLVKDDPTTNIPILWGSMLPIGGFYIDMCAGAFLGSIQNGKLVSRPGVAPTASKTISQFFDAAQQNGPDFGLVDYDWARWFVAMNLFEFGNPNVQGNIGNGVTGTNNSSDYTTPWSWNLGDTLSLGDACGKVDKAWTNSGGTAVQNASHVSLFGSEDNFCFWQMLQGIYCGSSSNSGQDGTEVFVYKGNRLPTSAELATHPAGDYRTITRLTTEGYIKKMLLGQHFDIFASATGGGGDSYWCDYQYANNTGQLVLLGGDANRGASCGLGYVYSYRAFSFSNAGYGSRLAYYGDIDLVDGADLATA